MNKYYAIPSINVDGVNYIEQQYKESGVFIPKRKNMHIMTNVTEKAIKNNKTATLAASKVNTNVTNVILDETCKQ